MQIRTYAVLVVARRHANAPRLALQCGVSLVYAARSRRRLSKETINQLTAPQHREHTSEFAAREKALLIVARKARLILPPG